MDLRACLLAPPGQSVSLARIDANYHGDFADHAAAQAEMTQHLARLNTLQQTLYAEQQHAVLIVLQGIDAAGKDGTCWHVLSAMNPQGTSVASFKVPTPEEARHDFLWRIHPHVPGRGHISVFNRSHYEDVLVARVHNLVPETIWSQRYAQINAFEAALSSQHVTILKFFLYITPDEQLARFRQRLEDPARQWKISEADYAERAYWDDYVAAFEAMLTQCSTAQAPWYIIPANHKWFRNYAVAQILANTLTDLNMRYPAPSVDLDHIRREYHAAEQGADARHTPTR